MVLDLFGEPINTVYNSVKGLLEKDNTGHNMNHVERVLKLALDFGSDCDANIEIIALTTLLHDVDDYKLFGKESAENLLNARKILDEVRISDEKQIQVLQIIQTMGYSKALKGIIPTTLEGQIVSDADMCDAIGASRILRVQQYSLAQNRKFFDKNIWPIENITANQYVDKRDDTAVCHFFEKLLKIKNFMLTAKGKTEVNCRHQFMVDFLYQFFKEENVPEWREYLVKYLIR